MQARTDVSFKVGDKAVYPAQGVAEVINIEEKDIAGTRQRFYVLRILDTDRKIMVPVSNASAVGLRQVISEKEIREIFDILRERTIAFDNQTWNRRYRGFMDKIKTGSIYDVAEVLRDLYRLKTDKQLSFGERRMLDTARIAHRQGDRDRARADRRAGQDRDRSDLSDQLAVHLPATASRRGVQPGVMAFSQPPVDVRPEQGGAAVFQRASDLLRARTAPRLDRSRGRCPPHRPPRARLKCERAFCAARSAARSARVPASARAAPRARWWCSRGARARPGWLCSATTASRRPPAPRAGSASTWSMRSSKSRTVPSGVRSAALRVQATEPINSAPITATRTRLAYTGCA